MRWGDVIKLRQGLTKGLFPHTSHSDITTTERFWLLLLPSHWGKAHNKLLNKFTLFVFDTTSLCLHLPELGSGAYCKYQSIQGGIGTLTSQFHVHTNIALTEDFCHDAVP